MVLFAGGKDWAGGREWLQGCLFPGLETVQGKG